MGSIREARQAGKQLAAKLIMSISAGTVINVNGSKMN
jgi:hypothetical protein